MENILYVMFPSVVSGILLNSKCPLYSIIWAVCALDHEIKMLQCFYKVLKFKKGNFNKLLGECKTT